MSSNTTAEDRHTVKVQLPFPSPEHARIALQVLQVDKELRSALITRTLSIEESTLVALFEAVSVRQARVALSHFMSDADLVVQTMESFAPDGLKKEAAQV